MDLDVLELPAYPRTLHLEGSGLPQGEKTTRAELAGALEQGELVVEEKVDGQALAILFDHWGELHVADGQALVEDDPRLGLLVHWLASVEHLLLDVLEDRYVLYGEWLEDKHTVFYDALPHFFLEYDLYDRDLEQFLATQRRREILAPLAGVLESVAVLHQGPLPADLDALLGPSCYKSSHWREGLAESVQASGADPELVRAQTLLDERAEGLYVKVEDEQVRGRYKLVRPEFVEAILSSGSHWSSRPRVRNRLAEGASVFR